MSLKDDNQFGGGGSSKKSPNKEYDVLQQIMELLKIENRK